MGVIEETKSSQDRQAEVWYKIIEGKVRISISAKGGPVDRKSQSI